MKPIIKRIIAALAATALFAAPAAAEPQTTSVNVPVVAHPDPESLFTSPDPKLHRNKQTAMKIIKELLEAGRWDRADQYLTERYIQHHPGAAPGRENLVRYFTERPGYAPKPIPEKMQTPVVAVIAEGDFVTVLYRREVQHPDDPSLTYTTTGFDTWRFVDGKADEHWDPDVLPGTVE